MLDNLDQDALISLVVFGILDLVAIAVLLAGLTRLARAKLRSGRLERIDATVVEHQQIASTMTGSGMRSGVPTTLVKPVLRYSAAGREYTLVSRIGSNVPPPIGSTLRVAYDRSDPARAEVDSGFARYLVPVVLTCAGLLLVALFTGVGWSAIH